jgi:hemerythrin superfamily protein
MVATYDETTEILKILTKYIKDHSKIKDFAKELVSRVGRKTDNQSLKETLTLFYQIILDRQVSEAGFALNSSNI